MKLNIGAGKLEIPGFTSIDRINGQEAYPLPYPDNSADEIRASHVLEHFGWQDVEKVVREWARVLKPGGTMKIAVPDFDKITDKTRKYPLVRRMQYLMGGQTTQDDFHRSAFDRELLTALMQQCGLDNITDWQSEIQDCASLDVSLNLAGTKASDSERVPVKAKMVAVMTVPRVGWNDAWGCVHEALAPWSIPLWTHNSVFWAEGFQNLFKMAIDNGADWVLAIDYDSMFTREHVNRLIHVMAKNPQIDALASLQPRRQHHTPLATKAGVDGRVSANEPFQVATAHFGLTIIRTAALNRMDKPWFWGIPNAAGDWNDDDLKPGTPGTHPEIEALQDIHGVTLRHKIDADIWFWKQWMKAGNTVYIDPECCIGHLEVMCVDFHEVPCGDGLSLEPRYMPPHEWRKEQQKQKEAKAA